MNNQQRIEVCKREAAIRFERALHAETQSDFNYYFKLGMEWLRASKAKEINE